ncbi:hypothetical protein VTN77DRAFT_5915 [Rasamsonia byssochlamydoides]|uniref:uncharacterized protein n=1 Tax=Rasamsonia byssochlamydoides TaxID=89139 RepID=UPI003742E1F8
MAARPAKRQRKLVVLSSDDETETQAANDKDSGLTSSLTLSTSKSTAAPSLPSRSKVNSTSATSSTGSRNVARQTSSSPIKKGKKRLADTKHHETSSSLHSFFQPATEEQRWSSRKSETNALPEQALDEFEDKEDLIEDDYSSCEEIFAEQLSKKKRAGNGGYTSSQDSRKQASRSSSQKGHTNKSSRPAKRFLLPASPSNQGPGERVDVGTKSREADRRPWPERYAPSNLDELAVHKKKVADVRNWLADVFAGKSRRRMLVLHGPAGSGKTATISLLSQVLGFDIVEWKNPLGSEQSSQGYTSLSAQFDEFLSRSNIFCGLDLDDTVGLDTKAQNPQRSPMKRVILIEEFPSTLARTSSALSAFRSSLHRYLAASVSPQRIANENSADMAPPIVIIVSETLLSTTASISDNFTIHRLLGPEICNHPGTSIIEFNRIAPTFMYKALDLVLRKEARHSMRKRIPSPAILKKFSELGDIRSAISSLEFLCLRGDESGDWGGRIAAKLKNPNRDSSALTPMERESLEMVTQREASLGLFHAVGKVVYNKREDPGPTQQVRAEYGALPEHLRQFERPRVSQVSIEDLMNETGTDIQTFISALHENYVPSCDGPSFTDCLEGCIQSLSDSDVLGSNNRSDLQASRIGVGVARTRWQGSGASIDTLRQDEISFHVAVRGLLFSLPDPVRRRVGQAASGSRVADAYKMYFPTSLRLWKETEELEGLVDVWARRLVDPGATRKSVRGATSGRTGVESWKSVEINQNPLPGNENHQTQATVTTMMSRDEILLHQLPYMAKIWSGRAEAGELERITQFRGIGFPSDEIPGDELDDFDPLSIVTDWTTDPEISIPEEERRRPSGLQQTSSSSTFGPKLPPPVEEAVEKLILSDDDIEDD